MAGRKKTGSKSNFRDSMHAMQGVPHYLVRRHSFSCQNKHANCVTQFRLKIELTIPIISTIAQQNNQQLLTFFGTSSNLIYFEVCKLRKSLLFKGANNRCVLL